MAKITRWQKFQQTSGWPFGPIVTLLWLTAPSILVFGVMWMLPIIREAV